jgi:hypothetical protein
MRAKDVPAAENNRYILEIPRILSVFSTEAAVEDEFITGKRLLTCVRMFSHRSIKL